jgi:hypothetical protein
MPSGHMGITTYTAKRWLSRIFAATFNASSIGIRWLVPVYQLQISFSFGLGRTKFSDAPQEIVAQFHSKQLSYLKSGDPHIPPVFTLLNARPHCLWVLWGEF